VTFRAWWCAALALPLMAADPLAPFLTGEAPRVLRDVPGAAAPAGVKVRRVVFASRNSEIFAVIAWPEKPGKYPGLLVLHGGGGNAEEAKALNWAARGYVALAPDLPSVANPEKVPNSSGPWKALKYGDGRWAAKPDASASTMFDGVVAGIQSLYLLRSLPEVDLERVGVTGISWGGYMTTMVASLAGPAVKAAFSVYGCGFYELTAMGGDGPLGKMPESERDEWLRHLDPGRRAGNMKASYFVSGATNDFFYWPPGVSATLRAIPGEKNQAFAPNANHKAPYPGGTDKNKNGTWLAQEVEYFGFHLKGEGKPFPVVEVRKAADPLLARVRITEPVAIKDVELWWSGAAEPWMKRKWSAVAARRVSAGEYEARLPAEAEQGADWFVLASDDRPVTVSSPMMHVDARSFKGNP
jgi:dienelactone hydrolase